MNESRDTFHALCGVMWNQFDRPDEAVSAYRRAIELYPDCVQAYLFRGALLEGTGNINEAKEKYLLASEIEPDNPVLGAHLACL